MLDRAFVQEAIYQSGCCKVLSRKLVGTEITPQMVFRPKMIAPLAVAKGIGPRWCLHKALSAVLILFCTNSSYNLGDSRKSWSKWILTALK